MSLSVATDGILWPISMVIKEQVSSLEPVLIESVDLEVDIEDPIDLKVEMKSFSTEDDIGQKEPG